MGVNSAYKETILGVLPIDWEVKTFREVFSISAAGDLDKRNFSPEFDDTHTVPIYANSTTDEGLYGYSNTPKYGSNSFTITARGELGRAFFRKQPFNAIGRLLILEPISTASGKFFAEYVNLFIQIVRESTGVPQLTAPQMSRHLCPVPPLSEQQAIAEAISDMDSLIAAQEALIEKKRAIKQGAMQELLTGRRRLPGFEGEWLEKRFADVMTGFSSGATPYRGNPEFFDGDINWITSGELKYSTIFTTNERITEQAVRKTNLSILPAGTFLIAITGLEAAGTRGSCGIVGTPSTSNQSCMALYPGIDLELAYLFHYYCLNGEKLALEYCQGTKQQSYTGSIVKTLPIRLPPSLEEQRAIALLLDDIDRELHSLEENLSKQRALKQGMMQELLTGRVRLV